MPRFSIKISEVIEDLNSVIENNTLDFSTEDVAMLIGITNELSNSEGIESISVILSNLDWFANEFVTFKMSNGDLYEKGLSKVVGTCLPAINPPSLLFTAGVIKVLAHHLKKREKLNLLSKEFVKNIPSKYITDFVRDYYLELATV